MEKIGRMQWLLRQRSALALVLLFSAFWCLTYHDLFFKNKHNAITIYALSMLPSSALSDTLIYGLFDTINMDNTILMRLQFAGMLVFGILMFFGIGVVVSHLLTRIRRQS